MTDNPNKSFAIVELQPYEQPPANTFAHGGDLLIKEFFDAQCTKRAAATALARADAISANAATREQEALTAQLQAVHTMLDAFGRRLDAYELRLKHKARADEEAEAQRVQAMLDELPDPDAPDTHPAPLHGGPGDIGPLPIPGNDRETQTEDDDNDEDITTNDPYAGSGATDPMLDPRELANPYGRNHNQIPQPISVSLNSTDELPPPRKPTPENPLPAMRKL